MIDEIVLSQQPRTAEDLHSMEMDDRKVEEGWGLRIRNFNQASVDHAAEGLLLLLLHPFVLHRAR